MHIEPTYTSVGSLFQYRPMFFIPKYQRAYAWDSESISDFIKDLKNCFDKRQSGSSINHFFGGVLSVKHYVSGAVNQHEYEIIDGQQRIATFILLVSRIIKNYEDLLSSAQDVYDSENISIIEGRIKSLKPRFIVFEQEIQRKITSVEVLKLSKADHPFYKELIQDVNSSPQRDSHKRILQANRVLDKAVKEIISNDDNIESKIDALEIIQNILDNDFTILHMVTENRDDAFRLFQVINDRGTNLTDGDLLRAKTLELLEGFNEQQDTVERLWDDILADSPSDTTNYLNWIYESYQGGRAKQNALFDMFIDKFFPQHKSIDLKLSEAQQVRDRVQNIHKNILNARKLTQGQWLHHRQQPITSWDINRLNILLVELGHTLSIPLFLAAFELDHRIFSEIVQIVEKVFFRYKLICNEHVTPLKSVYHQEAVAIRQNPTAYNVASLKNKLQKLIDSKAPDRVFKSKLETIEYAESGRSNKPLKYFLMKVEYYYQWYKNGASGTPMCLDKSRVYDFAGTSIEHVYPRNADTANKDSDIEPLKNTLGNLTIMDPAQNTIGGDDVFIQKKSLYQNSSVMLTKEIGEQISWTKNEIENHQNLLVDAAIAIFHP